MAITAKIILDSISPQGVRLTTMQLRYPKFIHGEFMTHRVFSRNASSSRAIPTSRLIQDVIDDPAMPVFWGKNRPGMQAVEELNDVERTAAQQYWLAARDDAVQHAINMSHRGLHKQLVNRVIEPWCHINVVVTATEWQNFYALRCHKDAQPEMRALADAMREAQRTSVPWLLQPGEWHLPYIDVSVDVDKLPSRPDASVWAPTLPGTYSSHLDDAWFVECLIKVSAARCARVSYMTHDGRVPDAVEDLALYERLAGSSPIHASPLEHEATPDILHNKAWSNPHQHGNLEGWRQYRKMLPGERAIAP